MIAAKRNFSCCYKTSSLFFDGVDVRFVSARIKSDSLQNFFLRDVRRNEKFKAVPAQSVQRILNKRLFKENSLILQIIEFRTGNFCSAVKIKQVKFFCKLNVIFRLKIKLSRSTDFFHFKIFCIKFSHRRIRMNHIRNLARSFLKFCFNITGFSLNGSNFFLYCLSCLNEFRPCFSVKFLLHTCGIFIAFLLKSLKFCNKFGAPVVQLNDNVCIRRHITVFNILFYSLKVVLYKFIIKHFSSSRISLNKKSATQTLSYENYCKSYVTVRFD